MNIVLDSPTARIWSDSNAPYAFSIFFSWPASENEFVKLSETYLELLRKVKQTFGEVYSICDISQSKGLPNRAVISLFETCVEKQLKLGLKRKAFVFAPDFPQGLFTQPGLVQSDKISFHPTFQQALTEVNTIRMNSINRSLSIL